METNLPNGDQADLVIRVTGRTLAIIMNGMELVVIARWGIREGDVEDSVDGIEMITEGTKETMRTGIAIIIMVMAGTLTKDGIVMGAG